MEQMFTAKQLGNDTPGSFLQTAWFYLMLYFGRRGRENQRNMVKGLFSGKKRRTAWNTLPFRERATKNRPGGLRDNEDNSQAVMCECPDNPEIFGKAKPELPSLVAKAKKLQHREI